MQAVLPLAQNALLKNHEIYHDEMIALESRVSPVSEGKKAEW